MFLKSIISLILCSVYFSSRTAVQAATASPPRSWRQQQTVEPLLRFPFANFLANPCGVMASTSTMNPTQPSWPGIVTERSSIPFDAQSEQEQATPAPLRAIPVDGSTLAQQTQGFLGPLRDRYTNRNYTREERSALSQEFHLVVLEAVHLVRHIYPPTALHHCDGIQLQSLSHGGLLVSPSGDIELEEVYRSMMITAAHLHLMIRDAYDSARFCPTENHAQHQNIRQLTGKVETMMCLMLHSAVGAVDYDNMNFFRVTQRVLQSTVHRYYDCSAREIRGCLVARYSDRIFSGIQRAAFSAEHRDQRGTEASVIANLRS